MDRLTKRFDGVVYGAEGESADSLTGRWYREEFECETLIEKLAEYEDAEENGLLLRLPCEIYSYLFAPTRNIVSIFQVVGFKYYGFDVFVKWKLEKGITGNFQIGGIYAHEIGKSVFLTKEEAEKALGERKERREKKGQ